MTKGEVKQGADHAREERVFQRKPMEREILGKEISGGCWGPLGGTRNIVKTSRRKSQDLKRPICDGIKAIVFDRQGPPLRDGVQRKRRVRWREGK